MLFDRNSVEKKKTILVVDEAHNLRDFLRGVHSATMTLDQIEGAIREADSMLMEEASLSLKSLHLILSGRCQDTPPGISTERCCLRKYEARKGSPCSRISHSSSALVQARRVLYCIRAATPIASSPGRRIPGQTLLKQRRPSKVGADAGPNRPGPCWKPLLIRQRIQELHLGLGYNQPLRNLHEVARPRTNRSGYLSRLRRARRHYQDCNRHWRYRRYKTRSPQMFSKISDKVAAVIDATETGVGVFAPSYAVLNPIIEMVSKRGRSEARGLRGARAFEPGSRRNF